MTVKDIIGQIEHISGRQPEVYMMRLINDGLLELGAKKQHYTVSNLTDLEVKKKWYELPQKTIDVTRVEIKDTDGRYVVIPKLVDPQSILKNDTDASDDTLI